MMRIYPTCIDPLLFHLSYSWFITLEDCTWIMDGALSFTKPIFVGRLEWYNKRPSSRGGSHMHMYMQVLILFCLLPFLAPEPQARLVNTRY